MKIFNIIMLILGMIATFAINYLVPTDSALKYVIITVAVMFISIIFTALFINKEQKSIIKTLIAILFFILSFTSLGLYILNIPDFVNRFEIAVGLKEEEIIDTTVDIYELDDLIKLTYDYQTNELTVTENLKNLALKKESKKEDDKTFKIKKSNDDEDEEDEKEEDETKDKDDTEKKSDITMKDYKVKEDEDKSLDDAFRTSDDVKEFNLSLTKLEDEEADFILENYHGKINVQKENVEALYGIFEELDEGESIATPYLKLDDGMYSIEGNKLVIDDFATRFFQKENIFTEELITITGNIIKEDGTKEEDVVLEKYYTDENHKYIFNGTRLYKDVYTCENYASIPTKEKMVTYIEFLGLQKEKDSSKIIGKEVLTGKMEVSKVRLYYYNNLDTLNYMEIIFKGQPNSMIIKEKDSKFKFANITNIE